MRYEISPNIARRKQLKVGQTETVSEPTEEQHGIGIYVKSLNGTIVRHTRWIGIPIGICCLLIPLWLVPELVSSLLYFRELRGYLTFADILGYVPIAVGFLVVGSIGMSLLTGEYHKHRRAFHWAWLVTGILSLFGYFVVLLSTSSGVN